jgi:hypothetical protein
MRSPQNYRSGLHFSCMSPDTSHSHITQPPVSRTPRHYLVTPMTFLVLVFAQNLHGHQGPCLQSSFTSVAKKFCSLSSFTDTQSCRPWLNLGATTIRQQDTFPWGRARSPPFPDECKIPNWAPKLLKLITLWCRKQTHKRQKIFFLYFFAIHLLTCAYIVWVISLPCTPPPTHFPLPPSPFSYRQVLFCLYH